MKSLIVYTELREKLAAFRDKNKAILDKEGDLIREVNEAEIVLKNEVREKGKTVEGDKFVAIYRPNFSVRYDYKLISRYAKPEEKTIIDQKALITEVDRKVFEGLVKAGQVSVDLERKAFQRDELTPRIVISEKSDGDKEKA